MLLRIIFILVIVSSFNVSFAQETKGLSDSDNMKAVSGYLKMSKTDTYKAMRDDVRLLAEKMPNFDGGKRVLENDTLFSKWISQNYKSTNFKTPEEAIEIRDHYLEMEKKLMIEYAEIFQLLSRATPIQIREILKPDFVTSSEKYEILQK